MPDSTLLINNKRPDIVFIILESFSGLATEPIGGHPGVSPNLNSYYKEGVGFTNFYANSFRTDRGLVSILSGYPSQPNNSIMKYPAKSQTLPGIPKSFSEAVVETLEFFYGGDSCFSNMTGCCTCVG